MENKVKSTGENKGKREAYPPQDGPLGNDAHAPLSEVMNGWHSCDFFFFFGYETPVKIGILVDLSKSAGRPGKEGVGLDKDFLHSQLYKQACGRPI